KVELRGHHVIVDPPTPPGFETSVQITASGSRSSLKNKKDTQISQTDKDQEQLKRKLGNQLSHLEKNIPMSVIMLWLSGNSVQIFSVMITGMLFFQPIKAMMSIESVFERYESIKSGSLIWQKLVYVLLQLFTMGLGLYKCFSMGLLPTATSDWLAFMEPKQ
ncbi:24883_t:CDS:2, partial [Racocetra persica]